ncbi:MAG: hypothetical protein IKU28_01370 [Erysipelotrichaceae bacterium]|nr:hypothetical protein [Erysipelotrichaceae bacterium]
MRRRKIKPATVRMINENFALILDCECKQYDDLIAALKKQEALKPEEYKDANDEIDHRCPECGSFAILAYCAQCGQKIDWSDIN